MVGQETSKTLKTTCLAWSLTHDQAKHVYSENKTDSKNMLPVETETLKKAHPFQLIYQGFYLHFASLWGPLRTSKQHRTQNKNWFTQSVTRWIQEYGSNLTVFLLGQATIIMYFPTWYAINTFFLLLLLPLLTVTQMFLDCYRSDSQVYFNPTTKTGLTVKTYTNQHGVTVWVYYNHFALPIGAKNGQSIREQLHIQAEQNKHILSCHAQNNIIAEYYLKEKPQGNTKPGKRPQLIWNYSGKAWEERHTTKISQLFGIHSTRNSGQIPLKQWNQKFSYV